MSTTTTLPAVQASGPNEQGYRSFSLGEFTFSRDEYFVYVKWPTGRHVMSVDGFLRALQRDVAWDFFYGIVNFDGVVGTVNHYGTVDLFAGRYNDAYRKAELDHVENFDSPTHQGDVSRRSSTTGPTPTSTPSPARTRPAARSARRRASNRAAITRRRVTAKRMVGVPGDEPLRSDENGFPINRQFRDVPQDEPVVQAEPGFENEVRAFNLFAYLSRSDVTWNPSVVSVCKASLYCPTTEEYILPIIHGNDRVEWFVQLSDEIHWEVEDRDTGAMRARVTMKAGDVAAMPADIRHQGYSPKRSMLLVWENASPELPALIASGQGADQRRRVLARPRGQGGGATTNDHGRTQWRTASGRRRTERSSAVSRRGSAAPGAAGLSALPARPAAGAGRGRSRSATSPRRPGRWRRSARPTTFVIDGVRRGARGRASPSAARAHPVEILVKDSQSDPNRAAEVAGELILKDKVDLMLVVDTPETTNPVSDQCEAERRALHLDRGAVAAVVLRPRRAIRPRASTGPTTSSGGSRTSSPSSPTSGTRVADQQEGRRALPQRRRRQRLGRSRSAASRRRSPRPATSSSIPGRYPEPAPTTSAPRSPRSRTSKRRDRHRRADPARLHDLLDAGAAAGLQAQGRSPSARRCSSRARSRRWATCGDGLSTEVWWTPEPPVQVVARPGERRGDLAAAYEPGRPRSSGRSRSASSTRCSRWRSTRSSARQGLDDKAAVRDAIVATNLDTIVGPSPGARGPCQNVAKTPLVGGQWGKGTAVPVRPRDRRQQDARRSIPDGRRRSG